MDTVIKTQDLTLQILIKATILDKATRIITFLIMQDLKEISAKKRLTRMEIRLDFEGNLYKTKAVRKLKIMGNLHLMQLPPVGVCKGTNPSIKEIIIQES